MVFANICEHASSAFIFASTSSDQILSCQQRALRKFSSRDLYLSFIGKKRFEPSNLADTVQLIPAAYSQLCLVGCQITSGSFA